MLDTHNRRNRRALHATAATCAAIAIILAILRMANLLDDHVRLLADCFIGGAVATGMAALLDQGTAHAEMNRRLTIMDRQLHSSAQTLHRIDTSSTAAATAVKELCDFADVPAPDGAVAECATGPILRLLDGEQGA